MNSVYSIFMKRFCFLPQAALEMEACDMKEWIGVIGTLSGAIVGGVIAFIVSARQISHQRRLERQKRLIEKFEQIHEVFGEVSSQGTIWAASVLGNVGANLPINPEKLGGAVRLDHLRMLVDFYAPTLKPEVEAIGGAWAKVARLAVEAIAETQRTDAWKAQVAEIAAFIPNALTTQSNSARDKLSILVKDVINAA